MKLRDKILVSLVSLVLFFWFLYLISSVLTPFIVAIIIAYFLNPLVGKLQNYRISRAASSLIILSLFLFISGFALVLILPLLYNQSLSLIRYLPSYFDFLVVEIYPKIVDFSAGIGFQISKDYHDYLNDSVLSGAIGSYSGLLADLMRSGMAIFNVLSLLFITPLLVFYMIKDWNVFMKKINDHLPSRYKSDIVKIILEIDGNLSGYVKGQFNVCLILGLIYSIGLTISGLNFGFLIGFLTGIISFIPFVGMALGALVALVVGAFQWGLNLGYFIPVISVFLIGQIIESNFLTPRLVGNKIGLHPVWMVFGLFVFGVLFGFMGVILAIPLTAIFGVIIKFLASSYKKSFC